MNRRYSVHVEFNKEEFEKEVAEVLQQAINRTVALVYKHTSVKEKRKFKDQEWFEHFDRG